MMITIIGNSVAAIGAIEAIRKVDKEIPITVISKEPYIAYGKPVISDFLKGKVKEEKLLSYRRQGFYEKNNVKLILNEEIVSIEPEKKKVIAKSGNEYTYKKLLIATGGVPFIPPFKGKDLKNVYTFTTLDDAKKLLEVSKNIKKAVIIGGGLIGLKAAEGLHAQGVKVSIIELMDRILSLAFDKVSGSIVENRMTDVGIDIYTEASTEEILDDGTGSVRGIRLKGGREIEGDIVVVAIGVVPNAPFAKSAGIEMNRGILVDEHMETNIKDIYAAGDVAEAKQFLYEQKMLLPIWPDAYKQGRVAGYNMVGVERIYEGGLSMNSIELFGISTISAGVHTPQNPQGYEFLIDLNEKQYRYRKIALKDNKVVGFIFVGDIDRAGIFVGLIRDKVDVSTFKDKLLKKDFGFIELPYELRQERFWKRFLEVKDAACIERICPQYTPEYTLSDSEVIDGE
jgi:NAD(P)H-nitrite reductase large subunit